MVFNSDTHCCWFGGPQIDCCIQPSCHLCHPVMRHVEDCGRCPVNSSEVTSPWGRQVQGPAGLSEGSVSWWRAGLQERGGPDPVLSEPLSPTACSSPWMESETLSVALPQCLAVKQIKQNPNYAKNLQKTKEHVYQKCCILCFVDLFSEIVFILST